MTEVSPAARTALDALTAEPTAVVKLLFSGGVGTGKSTVLGTVRDTLRRAGVAVLTRMPRPDESATAVVLDDVHLLTDAELDGLAELVADPCTTVVLATEPRQQAPALRALTAAVERERARIVLGPWTRAEVGRRLGITDSETLDDLLTTTAGLPLLVDAAATAGWSADGIARAAGAALSDRLRRIDEPVLSTLLLMSLSPGLGPADIAAVLDVTAEAARTLVDRTHATGLLDAGHGNRFTTFVHHTVAALVGAARHREIESTLLRSQAETSSLSTRLALTLAEHGLRDTQLAKALTDRAQHSGTPVDTARMLRAAIRAGADDPALRVRLADASARAGDCETAAACADELLGAKDPRYRGAAVRIAASVAMHDGNTGQAAELFDWLAEAEIEAGVGAAGTIALLGAGEAGSARALAGRLTAGPPTLTARATRSLAEGLLSTLEGPYPVAAGRLGQAIGASGPAGPEAMPDSAHALVALTALHAGDVVRARSVLGRADVDDPQFGDRHRLLHAWVRMQDGQLAAAAEIPAESTALHRRDALWDAALRTGIARRCGDAGALHKHWHAGMGVLAEYSVDLYTLLPLGELWVAGARLRQAERLTYPLDQAFGILRALGGSPGWSLPLHWAGVHAAILANAPQDIAPHAQALAAAADGNTFAATLAAAGRAWLRVLAQQVDAGQVSAAARGLAEFGLTWDATRLAGQAALQASDARVSGVMLQLARDLKGAADGVDGPAEPRPTDTAIGARPATGRSPLSEREREVAELLLLGMPYRDIGAQLFISAKTVEHHVARIRRRLGAESRSEMLSMLRAMLAPDT